MVKDWIIKDLSTNETVECETQEDVIDWLHRPIIEKNLEPENFEITFRGKPFKTYLTLGLEPVE